MTSKITIILTLNNELSVLRRCIYALKNQTFKRFDCLLINCKTDNETIDIFKAFTAQDIRFKYIDQNNTNLSVAKNIGIKQANSQYIIFWDSNNIPYPNTIKELYSIALSKNADAVISGVRNNQYSSKKYDFNENLICIDGEETLQEMFNGYLFTYDNNAILFKRDKLLGIYFDETITMYENVLFLLSSFLRCSNIFLTENILYSNIAPDLKISHSYNNDKASGLKALLYTNNALMEFETKTKTAFTEFAIEKLMHHAEVLSYGQGEAYKKGRFQLPYLMRKINLKSARKIKFSTKILCMQLKFNYSLFLITYRLFYIPGMKIKLKLLKNKKSKSKLNYLELQNLVYQIKSRKYEKHNYNFLKLFINKTNYLIKKLASELNLKK